MKSKPFRCWGESELRPERLFRRGKLYDVEEQTEPLGHPQPGEP